jgi:hypothetical protein
MKRVDPHLQLNQMLFDVSTEKAIDLWSMPHVHLLGVTSRCGMLETDLTEELDLIGIGDEFMLYSLERRVIDYR